MGHWSGTRISTVLCTAKLSTEVTVRIWCWNESHWLGQKALCLVWLRLWVEWIGFYIRRSYIGRWTLTSRVLRGVVRVGAITPGPLERDARTRPNFDTPLYILDIKSKQLEIYTNSVVHCLLDYLTGWACVTPPSAPLDSSQLYPLALSPLCKLTQPTRRRRQQTRSLRKV